VKCILINNYAFDKKTERDAAQFDNENLERLFGKLLGYNVIKMSDVSKTDLDNSLKNEAKSSDKCEALIFVIMTHGISNAIFTSDSQLVKISDILNYFNDVPEEIPKLFIIQACREIDLNHKQPENIGESENLKKRKNVFVWQSSVNGQISRRNLDGTLGSIFINCFLCVVSKFWEKDDLYNLFIKVNNLMAKFTHSDGKPIQISSLKSTANKLFCFKLI
jgi:hypothetical protein